MQRAVTAFLGAASGVMAVLLLAASGGPKVTPALSLFHLLGYNLLVVGIVLGLRTLTMASAPGSIARLTALPVPSAFKACAGCRKEPQSPSVQPGMNQDVTDSASAAVRPKTHPNASVRLAVSACAALVAAGLAGCGTNKAPPSAAQGRAPGESSATPSTPPPLATTTSVGSVTTLAVVQVECRAETAPQGADAYGVSHTGEKICTWGPELESRLDSRGFVTPSQNHPVDLVMANRCWSAGGRLYLRTPASNGWACIGGSPTTAPTARTALSTSSTLSLRGLGPVRIGMTLDEASAAAGTPLVARSGPSSDTCIYATPQGGPDGVEFMLVSGRIARVDVTGGSITTLRGAAVGDSGTDVQARYSGVLHISPHKYLAAGQYLTLVPTSVADAGFRLIFETDGSKVTRFRAGAQPEVSFVEGCS